MFRGTSQVQDPRFGKKKNALKKKMKFAPELNTKVDMKKVEMPAIMMWARAQLQLYLGFEDEVVEGLVSNMLEAERYPDPKEMQMTLTGFLEGNAKHFMAALWKNLISASQSEHAIPAALLEEQKRIRARDAEERKRTEQSLKEKLQRIQQDRDDIRNNSSSSSSSGGGGDARRNGKKSRFGPKLSEEELSGMSGIEAVKQEDAARKEHMAALNDDDSGERSGNTKERRPRSKSKSKSKSRSRSRSPRRQRNRRRSRTPPRKDRGRSRSSGRSGRRARHRHRRSRSRSRGRRDSHRGATRRGRGRSRSRSRGRRRERRRSRSRSKDKKERGRRSRRSRSRSASQSKPAAADEEQKKEEAGDDEQDGEDSEAALRAKALSSFTKKEE